jgi:signal transduction histidine kinase
VYALRTGPEIKIKLLYIMMAIIPVVVAYFFFAGKIDNIKQNEIQKNLEITKSNAGFIEALVLGKVKELVNLAEDHEVVELRGQHLTDTLKTFKTSENENFFIASRDGQVLTSTHTETFKILPQFKDNPYFEKALMGQPQISGQNRSVFTGDYVITVFAPVIDRSHKIIGVVGNELPSAFFREYLEPVKIGTTGHLNMMDQNGYYIYGNFFPDRNKLTLAKCYQEGRGQDISTIERKSHRSNEKTIYTMVRLKQLGWYVMAYQNSSEITAEGFSILLKDIAVVLMSIVTVIIIWLYKTALVNKTRLVRKQNAEKLALVGELAAGMAHEIRNPLTTIRGFCQILNKSSEYENHREIFDLVMQSVDHIDSILKETLMLARPQQIKLNKVNLQDILKETHNFMVSESLFREVNLELELEGKEAFVMGDSVHLKQVLINVIKNSLEATPKHGAIKVRLEHTNNGYAKIIVSDTGLGIRAEIMDKIGTPFFTTKDEGTGLGLSVCKRIVEEHQGFLKINSKVGRGTTIIIQIPLI